MSGASGGPDTPQRNWNSNLNKKHVKRSKILCKTGISLIRWILLHVSERLRTASNWQAYLLL